MKTFIRIIKEHFIWRSQIFKLAKSDIKKTYSGAALGWAWSIVKPTVTIFVFWFAFSIGLRLGGDIGEYPYILWLIAGYIPWFFMSSMLTRGAGALRKYSYLVTKVKFPISTVPTFVAIAEFIVHIALMVIVIAIFACFGFFPDLYLLQLPLYMLLMFFSFTIWGLFSSMLGALSKDFLNLVKSLTMAVFWLSGIMWDINTIGENHPLVQTVLMFNPVTSIATGYRNCFIYKIWIWEQPKALACFLATTVVVLILGVWSHYRLEKDVPDVL
jgi:teichoic acid transport system permease protein